MTPDRDLSARVAHLVATRPGSLWVGDTTAWLGWGRHEMTDPGVGPERYHHALEALKESRAPAALASFTFDEESKGSVVIFPEILARLDAEKTEVVRGDPTRIPSPLPGRTLPDATMVEQPTHRWEEAVIEALGAIRRGEVEKVVLSRTATARFPDPPPLEEVVRRLLAGEPRSHTFLVDRLVGSSPELLVSLREGTVRSVCLAGSAGPRDADGEADLGHDKTRREHDLAAESVHEALAPLCGELRQSPVRVARYGMIRHLSTAFEGKVGAGTTVAELLGALHPTAAVAGTPTKSALELIREIEDHDRGRYAGPVGWFDQKGNGEFAIALRCGLVSGATVMLYAGAGLVEGSDPRRELEETRLKLRPMLRALGLDQ